MSPLLPSTSETDPPDGEPRVVGVDSDDADEVLAALSAGTARTLLAALHEEPATPSELAERADTSLQNAQYHLGKLQSADLVEVHDTRYSEKGREMNVYAPADAPLVLFAGSESEGRTVRSTLASLLGAVGVLGVASLLVQYALGGRSAPRATTTGGGGGDGGISVASAETTRAASEAAGGALALPPGVLFFLGGLLALLAVGAWLATTR